VCRGRNSSVSDERVLLEILLSERRLVKLSDIDPHIPLSKERIRQILEDMEQEGYVEVEREGMNFYRLTDDGHEHLKTELRDRIN